MKFLRRTWKRYSKLGRGRKKKQVWRRPTGRDNKMREKRKGYPKVVSIGYKKSKKLGKNIVVVKNIKDLGSIKKNEIPIIGKVGKKKKIDILKKAKERKISIQNINTEKFLKKNLKIKEEKIEEKKKSEDALNKGGKNESK